MGERLDYYVPKKEASFSGAHRFPKPTQEWLQSQDTYTLHKPVRKNFKRRKTIVPGANFQMQADLIDFSLLKSYNDRYKYILVVIDVFSKKAFTAYLKNKTSSDMIQVFEQLMPEIGKFQKLQTDMGREFLNRPFQNWLKQHHIEHFHTQNFDTKATIAERFIRTLKEKLWRYFTYTNSRRYVEVLPALVESYNNTYHRSIRRAPNSVNSENQEAVWLMLYADPELRKPKLKVGDQVRLSMTRMRFRKGYLPGWTDELFQVAQVFRDNPPYYKIKDLQGEWLEGTFYEEELQKIYKKDDVFRIERILQQRKRKKGVEFLVKWFGYPTSFNSWVPEKDMVCLL